MAAQFRGAVSVRPASPVDAVSTFTCHPLAVFSAGRKIPVDKDNIKNGSKGIVDTKG
jgi:hypothetical protein